MGAEVGHGWWAVGGGLACDGILIGCVLRRGQCGGG